MDFSIQIIPSCLSVFSSELSVLLPQKPQIYGHLSNGLDIKSLWAMEIQMV